MRFRPLAPALLVFAGGVLFSLYLQTLVQPDVFYSCDGGLKFLYTRQLAERGLAGLRLDLDLRAPEWVQALWDAGMYPFEPPFVWESARRRYVEYPPFFSLLTAPLYRWFGFRGLYVVPLLSLWGAWLVLLLLGRRLGLGALRTAAALALCVFATPLTLYSAMYWEHTLALLLLVCGLSGLAAAVTGGSAGTPHGGASAAAGAVLGLSAWLRPEHLLFCAILLALLFALPRGAVLPSARRRFALGLVISIAAFFLWNLATSGALLGWQGLQLTTSGTMPHLGSRLAVLAQTTRLLALTCPVAIAALALGFVGFRRVSAFDRLLLGLAVAFWLAMPLVFPNVGGLQWGARYLLPLAPIAALLAARLAGHPAGLALVAAAGIAGAFVDCGSGVADLARNYRERQTPAMELLRNSPVRCVLTNTQYVTMELTAAFGDKIFFVLRDPARIRDLAAGMARGGEREILLLLPGRPPRVLSTDELLRFGAEIAGE